MVYHCHCFSLIHALAVGRIRTAINTAPPGSLHFCPHFCVGFLFLVVHSRASCLLLLLPPPPPTQITHTQLPHTHDLLTHATYSHKTCSYTTCSHTHNLLTHTQLTHTELAHTQLAHTHNLLTHNLFTHTTCSHTLSHTHNLLTHNLLIHNLLSHTQLTHTELAHTQLVHAQLLHTQLTHTQRTHTQLLHTQLVHTQLLHRQLTHWILRGRRGTYGTGLALVGSGGHRVCLRGRHGTWWHRPSLCVAGVAHVALGDIDVHFVWQVWHLWHWAGSGGALGSRWRRLILCVRRRGTLSHTSLQHAFLAHHIPIPYHLFSLSCLSHPIFTFLWILIGRSWHVGLSGPLARIGHIDRYCPLLSTGILAGPGYWGSC